MKTDHDQLSLQKSFDSAVCVGTMTRRGHFTLAKK